jgi:hypothetical protein
VNQSIQDRLRDYWEDPEKRAILFRLIWMVSLGMLVLGYLLIILFWFVL